MKQIVVMFLILIVIISMDILFSMTYELLQQPNYKWFPLRVTNIAVYRYSDGPIL